jgi:tetratricopeptide (TPR) repeat protein
MDKNIKILMDEVVLASRSGKLQEAEALCQKIISIDSENVFGHVNLANIFFLKGDVGKAIDIYRYALKIKPDDLLVRENLSLALIGKGMLSDAEKEINEILKVKPDSGSAYNLLGNIYFYKKEFNNAKEYYEKVTKLVPTVGDGWSNLGNVYFELGDLNKAEACYHTAIQLNPKNPYWHTNLGRVLIKQSRIDEAIDSYKKALEINPSMNDIKQVLLSMYIFYGNKLHKEGNMEAAEKFYQDALLIDNGNISLYNILAGIKLFLNDYAGAAAIASVCKKNCPSIDLSKYPNLNRFK